MVYSLYMLKFLAMPEAEPEAEPEFSKYADGFRDAYNRGERPVRATASYHKGYEDGEKSYSRRGTSECYDDGFKEGLCSGLEAVNPYVAGSTEAQEWCIGLVHGSIMKD
jgi:hypothetical protein